MFRGIKQHVSCTSSQAVSRRETDTGGHVLLLDRCLNLFCFFTHRVLLQSCVCCSWNQLKNQRWIYKGSSNTYFYVKLTTTQVMKIKVPSCIQCQEKHLLSRNKPMDLKMILHSFLLLMSFILQFSWTLQIISGHVLNSFCAMLTVWLHGC